MLEKEVYKMLKKGIDEKEIVRELRRFGNVREVIDLVKLRIKAKEKFSKALFMYFDEESLETSTPELVADYRAKRLQTNKIADLCCGIGGDTIAFAKNRNKVFAIEKDKKILEFAKKNCSAYNLRNVEFLNSDVMEIDLKKLNCDAIFSDPNRRIFGKRVKSLNETIPRTDLLVEKIKKTHENFCIEVSSQHSVNDIPYNCEKEFISLNGELNCLSLYFGEFKKCESSAVVIKNGIVERLESGNFGKIEKEIKNEDRNKEFGKTKSTTIKNEIIEMIGSKEKSEFENFNGTENKEFEKTKQLDIVAKYESIEKLMSKNFGKDEFINETEKISEKEICNYLYEIDESVLKAGLVHELIEKLGKNLKIYKQKFLTSDNLLNSNFFKNSFEVLEITNKEFSNLTNVLNKHNAKKVVLRGKFSENEQLKLKKKIENELIGEKKLHVFVNEKTMICRNLGIKLFK